MPHAYSRRCRRWTKEEEARLRVEYPDSTSAQLSDSFGRSYETIHMKAKSLGLRKSSARKQAEQVSHPTPLINSPIDVFLYRTPSPFPVEFS